MRPTGLAASLILALAAGIVASAVPAALAKDSGKESIVELSHAVLYEEDPGKSDGVRFVGSVAWRTESAGDESGIVARADIEIPERHISVTWSLRKNDDKTLSASHVADIKFRLPLDFAHGSIQSLPGMLMKQTEQTRGSPLAGRAAKLEDNHFLVGLSAAEGDAQRNIQLLKELNWIDLPLVYADGLRAILSIEKGGPGGRIFADSFAQWKQ